ELDAAEDLCLSIDLPEVSRLPAQVPSDGLDELESCFGDRPGFGEDTGHVMLAGHALPPPLPIRDIADDSGEHAGAGQRKLADRQIQREGRAVLPSPLHLAHQADDLGLARAEGVGEVTVMPEPWYGSGMRMFTFRPINSSAP